MLRERVDSGITETYIEHKPLDIYLINTHAFHNAHLIRAILPRDLTAPIPYTTDRRSHHSQIAQKLRITQDSKRAATALKAAEKKKAVGEKIVVESVVATAATSTTEARRMTIVIPACRKRRRVIEGDEISCLEGAKAMDVT